MRRSPAGGPAEGVARQLSRVAAAAALASYGFLLVVATLPVALGWNSSVVMSGSMRPAFEPGDVVLSAPVHAQDLRPGEVVLVDDPVRQGHLLMHRYVMAGPGETIVTRGDANAAADSTPVPLANVRGLPRARVPWVGLPVLWLRAHALAPLLASCALVSIAVFLASGSARSRTTNYRGRRRAATAKRAGAPARLLTSGQRWPA